MEMLLSKSPGCFRFQIKSVKDFQVAWLVSPPKYINAWKIFDFFHENYTSMISYMKVLCKDKLKWYIFIKTILMPWYMHYRFRTGNIWLYKK